MGGSKFSGLSNWIIGMAMTFAETRSAIEDLVVGESWPIKSLDVQLSFSGDF